MITGKPVIIICILQHQIILNDLDHKLLSIDLHIVCIIVLIVFIGFCCVKDIKNKLTTLLITKVLSSFAIFGGHFIYVSFSDIPGPEFLRTALGVVDTFLGRIQSKNISLPFVSGEKLRFCGHISWILICNSR